MILTARHGHLSSSQVKIEILYPSDYLPTPNAAQTDRIEKFTLGLESALQTTRKVMSIAEQWKSDCPDGEEHSDIAAYLETVSSYLAC